jgi:hypothetical protein
MAILLRLAASAGAAALLAAPAVAQQNSGRGVVEQVQLGDAFASMIVVAPKGAREATAVATAAGNTASGSGSMIVADSRQAMRGATFAWSQVEGSEMREATAVTTAQGNAAQAQATGYLDLRASQATADDVFGGARVDAGWSDRIYAASSSAGNNLAASVRNGASLVDLNQATSASVYSAADVAAWGSRSTVAGASAVGNALGSTSRGTVDDRYSQTSSGREVYGAANVTQAEVRDVTAATTSAGNSASIENERGYAQIRGRQANSSLITASTSVMLGSWSDSVFSSAYGVGNSTLATNMGGDLAVDIGQANAGDVLVSASFQGSSQDRGDAVVASTAIGNVFSGYACSSCGDASVYGAVRQSSSGDIVSTGNIIAKGAGNLIGSASAIGNSASFITATRDD